MEPPNLTDSLLFIEPVSANSLFREASLSRLFFANSMRLLGLLFIFSNFQCIFYIPLISPNNVCFFLYFLNS